MTRSTGDLPPDLRDRLTRQLRQWRSDLLALDRRQRLLYFTHVRTASLELVQPSLEQTAALVRAGRVAIDVLPVPDPADPAAEPPRPPDGLIVGNKTAGDLATALRRLDQQSQQVYADRGFWTLYVALGMVRWIDPDGDRPVESPILLVPVTLRRSAAYEPYRVARTEDEVVVNPVLRLKFENDFGLKLPEYDDEDATDVEALLGEVGEIVRDRPGWGTVRRAVMTTFSFHKEAIYRDLLDHEDQVAESGLVQLLALGPDAPAAGDHFFEAAADDELDRVVPPEKLLSILDADGSQRRCILAARDGRSFVMDGPPGTGKSQTIANIVVELMAAGRSVLFVSEKAAALDVVRRRLDDAGLTRFLLELHSHAATRKHVAQAFGSALSSQVRAQRQFPAAEEASLVQARQRLTDYATAMNERRPGLGRSLHQVLGRLAELHPLADITVPGNPRWAQLDAAALADVRTRAEQLSRVWRPVAEGADFLWRDLRSARPDSGEVRRLVRAADELATASRELSARADAVDTDLGMHFGRSVEDVRRRVTIIRSAARWPPQAPVGWLLGDLPRLRERMEARRAAAEAYAAAVGTLRRSAGPRWGELDGDLAPVAASLRAEGLEWRPDGTAPAPAVQQALEFLEGAPSRLVGVEEDARRLAATLGMRPSSVSLDRAAELAELGGLATSPARPEAVWMNPAVQSALDESARVLGELVGLVRQRQQSLTTTFTPAALELDLPGLRARFATHRGLRRFTRQARADRAALRAVTVTRKVTKEVVARLDEAVAWQHVERSLSVQEQVHAPRLGSYYRRTDTDFGRVASAVEVAHRAVRLAGEDLNASALARELALGPGGDPSLSIVAQRLGSSLRAWRSAAAEMVGPRHAAQLGAATPADAAEWCAARARDLRPGAEVVGRVAEIVGAPVTVDRTVGLLEEAGAAARIAAAVSDGFEDDERLLGPGYRAFETDWTALADGLAWADELVAAAGGPLAPYVAEHLRSLTFAVDDLAVPLARWVSCRDELLAGFAPERAAGLADDFGADVGESAAVAAGMHRTAAVDIDEWVTHRELWSSLDGDGFGPVLDELARRRKAAGDVADAVERAACEAWADAVAASDARLTPYRSTERDALVDRFRLLDRRLVADAHAAVIAACAGRSPRGVTSRGAQVIRKEGEKKSRHKPIRQLLTEAGDVALALKPCFMMSPLSVSQYLPPGLRFDTVIFDEASQVLPSDAINSVYRGSQLIVAGDQKQLPPTAFFARAVEDELDDEDADLDKFQSVLDLCKAAGAFGSLPLRWHYRSRHESLITYSNYRFYGGDLHTFPGAVYEAADLGVTAVHVPDGVYRRGGARDNPVEAAEVARRVIHHRTAHPELSLGVVTFSVAQEEAVLAALESAAPDHPEIADLLQRHDRLDGFFVKNLENVQGDERDIIVFSVGYGPDEHGRFTMNFGPLNKDGGWRRLNVAVTRARRRVEIVSSFRAGQIGGTTSEGVRHLQGYLDFAERGIAALALDVEAGHGDAESPFEEDVARVIASLGYDAVHQVGAAGYRIDLGVKHPDRPGSYLLAVECDGAAYHSAKAARDRDRLREDVLRGLGWDVHRIWGISWVRDRDGQVERLRRAIESALERADGSVLTPPPRLPDPDVVVVEDVDWGAAPEWTVPYPSARRGPFGCPYAPDLPEARPYLRAYLEAMMRSEAPIHDDVVMRALRADWNIGRIGRLIRSNVDKALYAARVDGRRPGRDDFGFWRVEGRQLDRVRVPSGEESARGVAHVPPEELDLAVGSVIGDAVVIERDVLGSAVARVFGWGRLGPDIQAAVASSVSRLLAGGMVMESEGRLRLPHDPR